MNFMKRFLSKGPEDEDQSSDVTLTSSKEELISTLLLIRNDINEMVVKIIEGLDPNRLIKIIPVEGGVVEIIFRHNGYISIRGAGQWTNHREIYEIRRELDNGGYVLVGDEEELVEWARRGHNHDSAVESELTRAFKEIGYVITGDEQVFEHRDKSDYLNLYNLNSLAVISERHKYPRVFVDLKVTKSKVPQVFNNINEMREDLTAIGNDLVNRHLVPLIKGFVNKVLTAYRQNILPSFPVSQNTILPTGNMAVSYDEINNSFKDRLYISFGDIAVSEKEVEFFMAYEGLTSTWMYRVFSDYQHEHVLETAFSLAMKESGFTKNRATVTADGDVFNVKIS